MIFEYNAIIDRFIVSPIEEGTFSYTFESESEAKKFVAEYEIEELERLLEKE
jgi:hypothetical protein